MKIEQQKINEWVQLFLGHVNSVGVEYHTSEEEGYKFEAVENFQKFFNLDEPNLPGMLERALLNNNLVVGSMFYPRKMLVIFATESPEEVRGALRHLFDESIGVEKRLTDTELFFENLMTKRNASLNESSHSYITLRFLSLLLGLRYPEGYNPLKPSEWRVFAKFLNEDFTMPKRLSAGEQYDIYQPYIETLREALILNPAIKQLRDKLTERLLFKDNDFRWMTQNVIYVGARTYAKKIDENVEPLQRVIEEEDEFIISEEELNTGFFAYEKHLEEFIIMNWKNINFGEELDIYVDEGGSAGQQYTTDVGIIDILATDKNGDYVVIELKRAESGYKVVGQVLNYMGWVNEKIAAEEGKKVRGIIVVGKADKTLKSALKLVADKIELKEYRTNLNLIDPV